MSLSDIIKKKAAEMLGKGLQNTAKDLQKKASEKKTMISLAYLPNTAEELKSLPAFSLKNEYVVAALTVTALMVYPENRAACFEMMNVLKGPEPLSERDKQFINDRFMDGKDYVMRSYFEGTSPENNYAISAPYQIEVTELPNSRENDGYVRLFMKSSGADSLRYVVLRNKPSTGEWFLWEFQGITMDIRIPKEQAKWA